MAPRPLLAALLLALAAPGRAEPVKGRPVWETDASAVGVLGCSSQETKEIRSALEIAALYARNCLGSDGGPGLAPDIGQKILDALDRRQVDFTCSDEADGEEGETTFDAHMAHVRLVSWPPPSLADPGAENFGGAALHELIHAVDPLDEYLTTAEAHNRGFADRVYACHAACEGRVRPGIANNLTMLELALGGSLPKNKTYRCKQKGAECDTLRKLAHICTASGAAKVLPAARIVEKRIVGAKCLQRAVSLETAEFACNAKACLDERAAFLKEGATTGMQSREWIDRQGERYSAIAKAAREASPEALGKADRRLFDALERAGTLKSCGLGS